MTFLDAVLTAIIQGITAVLPLDPAGHLALLPHLPGTAEDRAAIAVAADCGIVVALSLYFWRDLMAMAVGLWKLAKGRPDNGTRLFLQLVLGTLPAVVLEWGVQRAGIAVTGEITAAGAMVVFGLFLLVADKLGMTVRRIDHMSMLSAFAIGALQAASVVPGLSRTGVTITAARLLGYERTEAGRFSLLLAIPTTAIAAIGGAWRLSRHVQLSLSGDLAVTTVITAVVSLLSIAAMLAWVQRASYTPFAVWRILLGSGVLLSMAWGGV